MKNSALLCLLAAGCGGSVEAPPAPVTTLVMQTLHLAREEPEGISPGFNLDGWVSNSLDTRTCSKDDFVDTSGATGIDNQLARLLPLIDLAGQGAVDALVQAAIGEGRLLVLISIQPLEGDRVALGFERGDGVPLLGTDSKVLSGQTLALHPETMLGVTEGTRNADGSITADAFALKLPIVVFGILYLLDLPETQMRFTVDESGNITTGILGGAVPVEQLIGFARQAGDSSGNDFVSTFGEGIRDAADMERNNDTGVCDKMSLAATFDGVPAFKF